VAPTPVWTEDEWALLLDLYLREGRAPAEESIADAHNLLRALGLMSEDLRRRRSAENPSYRSVRAVWAQFYLVRALDDPTKRVRAPQRLQALWDAYERNPELVAARVEHVRERVSGRRPFDLSERASLKLFLTDLTALLAEAVEAVAGLPRSGIGEDLSSAHAAAWADLQRRSALDSMNDELDRLGSVRGSV
jgi:hypothetical protein